MPSSFVVAALHHHFLESCIDSACDSLRRIVPQAIACYGVDAMKEGPAHLTSVGAL